MTLYMSDFKGGFGYFQHTNTSENYMMAAFLVIVAISGNFLAETLGCQFQKLLNNMIFKNLLIYFTIYFTIEISSSKDIIKNPSKIAWESLMVWTIFKFFTRMNIIPTIIVILVGVIIFVISQYRNAIENNNRDKMTSEKLLLIQNILYNSMIVIIFISVIIYYFEKRKEHNKSFNFLTFLFGVNKCKSLK